MPAITRPDGVEIHWRLQGEGPLVLLAHQAVWSYPEVYADLIADLATDHAVATYDPRGCGESSRRGPYDVETDAGDFLAVAEAAGTEALALSAGYGYNLAVRVADRKPDLIHTVVGLGPAAAAMLPRSELRGADVMAGSESVIELLLRLLRTDPRKALHSIVAMTNPELDEEQLRERLERTADYISPEAALGRAEAWLEDDMAKPAAALGDRLWILHSETESLFEGVLGERVAELFPKAHIEQVPAGPVSRPDVVASWIRRLTG